MKKSIPGNIILSYHGPIAFDTIGELISKLKERMHKLKIKQVIYKKVLMIMIESLENVLKYHEHFENDSFIMEKYAPDFLIDRHSGKIKITCSNAILNKHLPNLTGRLSQLKELDISGIKELYKTTITDGHFTEKGGAGLGIIEMAKICEGNFNYYFEEINKVYSYYTLELIVVCE